jgi:putative flippase GtrA
MRKASRYIRFLEPSWNLTTVPHSTPSTICQFIRFGLVGVSATLTHILFFVAFIEVLGIGAFSANVIAYVIACFVGYSGHSTWTFRLRANSSRRTSSATFAKFIIASLCGLAFNALIVLAIVQVLSRPYFHAIPFMATVVPLAVFMMNKLWVFADVTSVSPNELDK